MEDRKLRSAGDPKSLSVRDDDKIAPGSIALRLFGRELRSMTCIYSIVDTTLRNYFDSRSCNMTETACVADPSVSSEK